MSIIAEYSLWWLPVCLLIGAAYSFILYYKNRNVDFGKHSMMVMAALRGVVIALIAFLFLAPIIKMTIKQVHKPIIFFAIDNSESIILTKDSTFYKTEYINQLQKLMDDFGNQYEVIPCLMGEQNQFKKETKEQHLPDFSDKATNLSLFFDDISSLYMNKNIGAVVMLSDGIYNTGSNPYYKAEKAKYPIYTVGLGNTDLQPDFFIAGVVHNRQTFKGNYFPVEIKVAANKLSGKSAVLTVSENEKVLHTKNITFSSAQYFETVKMSIEAAERGIHRYTITLTEVDGEVNYKNNIGSFYVEVIDSREKIAIVYHAPHPDVSAIRQSLSLVDKYQVEVFPVQEFKANPGDYSLIILHQLPSQTQAISSLLSQIAKDGVSTLFILGEKTALPQFNTLNTGLQLTQSRQLFNESMPAYNDNYTAFTFSEETKQMLKILPPLRTFFGDYKTTVSSNVFMYQKISNVTTSYPLILFNEVNGTKTGIIAGEGIWQWRVYNYLYAKNHDAFNEIINKSVQLLSVKNDKSFFRVHAEQLFNENDDIELSAELYNESYELINEPDVNITISGKDDKQYEARFSKQQNGYALNMGRLPVGDYSWQASVKYGQKSYSKSGVFTVREMMLEASGLVADHTLLQNISHSTNGHFYTVEQMQEIAKEIKNNENIKPIASYNKKYGLMLDTWWYFALIIMLFAVEWFMRKWGGGY